MVSAIPDFVDARRYLAFHPATTLANLPAETEVLGEMLHEEDPVQSTRVMKAMLQMTKLDIKTLRRGDDQE